MRRTQIYLKENQYSQLRKIAFAKQMKISEVIRDFIDESLINDEEIEELTTPFESRKVKKYTIVQERFLRKFGFIE